MLEINVKEMRSNLSVLLARVERGEEIVITKHGRKIARLISVDTTRASLPSLADFRSGIKAKGKPLSRTVIDSRNRERY